MTPEKAYEITWDSGKRCETCPHLLTRTQQHPYGDGYATETYYDCDVAEQNMDVTECPGVVELLDDLATDEDDGPSS